MTSREHDGEHGHDGEPMQEGEEAPPPGVRVMAIVRWTLIVLMAVAAGVSVLSYLGVFARASASGPAAAQKYHCPMHPQIIQDRPGECPICGMDLVPVENHPPEPALAQVPGGHQHGGAPAPAPGAAPAPAPAPGLPSGVPGLVPIELAPDRIQLMGMRTATVERASLVPEIRTVGYVTAAEDGLARIQTRFSGWIEELLVNETGASVKRGQVLATVYSPELLTAQQEYLVAIKWASPDGGGPAAQQLAGRLELDAHHRLELLGVSPQELDELKRSGKPMRALKIRSPVTGYVVQKNAFQGQFVQPDAPLFEVADLSTAWVIAEVYEYEIGRVRAGQSARLTLPAYPGVTMRGKITFVYPTLDAASRTLKVRLEFQNRDLRLRPGMYGDVHVELARTEGLVVPREAIVDTGELQYLFVALSGGRFEPRLVKLGSRTFDRVEILEGVSAGETVVTTANFLIDSESRLRAAVQGMGAAAGGGAGACDAQFDRARYPEKHAACVACEVLHRGMGQMVDDCKNAIPRPWK